MANNQIFLNLDICGIVTPINKNLKSKSNIDYKEQLIRDSAGDQMMWDDAKGNPTIGVGGLFGFVHNSNRVEYHMIIDIMSPNNRLPSWSENVGQTDRNVLLITEQLYTINWDKWIELGGPKRVQGTTRVVGAHESITNYLHDKLEGIYYMRDTNKLIKERKV